MCRKAIISLMIFLLIITTGCATNTGKGYMALDALYKEIDDNPGDVLNQQDEKTLIYTNIAGQLSDQKNGLYVS